MNARYLLLSMLVLLGCFALAGNVFGQGSCDFSKEQTKGQQGSTVARSETHDVTGAATPTRVVEKRTKNGNRTIITRTLETVTVEGRYEPVAVCEEESVQLDKNTQRSTVRSYGFNPDHARVLIETSEAQTRDLGNGAQSSVRTLSRPDESGQLRVARREVEETHPAGANAQETRTTVLLPDVNGGLATDAVTHEVRRKESPGVEQVRRTQMLPDGNGGWKPGEVREEVVRTDAKGNRTSDRKVYSEDANLGLSLSQRTVTHETKQGTLVTRDVQSYGQAPTEAIGAIQLDERMRVVRNDSPGGKTTQERVEQRNPIMPSDGLHTTQTTVDVARPNAAGGSNKQTVVRAPDPNGRMTEITVSFGSEQPTK